MADTRPDDDARERAAWGELGDWLRDLREARGYTLDEVGVRAPGRSVSSRLRQIERNYHPYGFAQTGTLRRVELGMWIRTGRLDEVLSLARRGLDLPDPYAEPVVQPPTLAPIAPAATSRTATRTAARRRTTEPGAHRATDSPPQRQTAAQAG